MKIKNKTFKILLILFELVLYVAMIFILIVFYRFFIGESYRNLLDINFNNFHKFYSIISFFAIIVHFSQLTIFEKYKFSVLNTLARCLILLICTFGVMETIYIKEQKTLNNKYSHRADIINAFVQKSDFFIKYSYDDNYDDIPKINILNNHKPETLFIDYDNYEIAFLHNIYSFDSYKLSTVDLCENSDYGYKIQYRKRLESPGLELITYYDFGPEYTKKVELIMSDGKHYYACPDRMSNFRLYYAINNEK